MSSGIFVVYVQAVGVIHSHVLTYIFVRSPPVQRHFQMATFCSKVKPCAHPCPWTTELSFGSARKAVDEPATYIYIYIYIYILKLREIKKQYESGSTIFLEITPCCLVEFNRHFTGIYWLHLHGRIVSPAFNRPCKIWGSHSGGYEEFCLLGCSAVYSTESQPTIRSKRSPPSSVSKNKPSKKPAWSW
jgi:hypothetical protein